MFSIHGDKGAVEKVDELKQKLEALCKGCGLEGSLRGEGATYSGTYGTAKEPKKDKPKYEPKKYDPSQYVRPEKKVKTEKKEKKKSKKAEKVENIEKVENVENVENAVKAEE